MSIRLNRRRFLQAGSAAGLGYLFTGPAFSVAKAFGANDRLRVAGIGVGGKGRSDIEHAGQLMEVVALCDIDESDRFLGGAARKFPEAKTFNDYRKMLEALGKQIDAVTVSTPDHHHAPAAVRAMQMGKHVYVQKPLTHTVFEARVMREVARKNKVCSQMGNQGTAADGLRHAVEFVWNGGLGQVKEIHVWTNRPIWPQAPKVMHRPDHSDPVPPTVHWDEWLGPAPKRPYVGNRTYHDFAWRGWWDFGTGALGDMACHTANMAFMACKLAHPTSVTAEAGDVNPETYPSWASITWQFPARGELSPLAFHWYEGKRDGKKVLPPEELLDKARKNKLRISDSGSLLVGEKGMLFSPNDYGAEVYHITADGAKKLSGKPEKLPSNNGGDLGQKREWVEAIKANKPKAALSNFDYAGMLTETILLGNIAIKLTGEKLEWDGPGLRFPNSSKATHLVTKEYRKGWELGVEKV
jgi:predicted dehydrogenase